ncbi:MAG: peptide-methionine (S)-S-oxide reductase MsrA [Pseudomonadota bacterium]|nr:peptide-methionine (S)-S-oxide reductase MsrA [Pseudomonadota bacterium]
MSALAGLALALALAAAPAAVPAAEPETAVFAGGCFWCVESDMEALPGVIEAVSGYAGGASQAPSYAQVSAGGTGHLEAVEVLFDPDRISYATLVRTFLRTVDPLDAGGQFCDRGPSYATAIFAQDDAQAATARAALDEASAALGQPVVTPLREAARFWPAEAYHQDYAKTHPLKYRFYRWNCGRDARVEALWGAPAGHGGEQATGG